MLSGERFHIVYQLSGSEREAYSKAQDICLEQTVEFPEEFLPDGFIRQEIVGRIEQFSVYGSGYMAEISFAVETAADEFTQLINVIFGNISIKPGIRVVEIKLPPALLGQFKGPRFGRAGLRALLGIPERPLLFTALKPMGLSAGELADLAYQFALGGIDIIKDDHGLTNQRFAPFEERVQLCVAAVEKANRETGYQAIYMPNITAPAGQVLPRARLAKALGAKGLMLAPAITGLDTLRQLADDDALNLPVFSHPAFQGSYVLSEHGIGHYALFGQLTRLAGADAVIYPNFGGRFSFSREECEAITKGTDVPMEHIKSIFPSPGGGMSLERIPELLDVYGRDVIFLIGGGLFKHSSDLVANCRYFRNLVENFAQAG